MKKLELTRHAEVKLVERGLKVAWVERTARNPLWVEHEPGDQRVERRFGRIEEHGGRTLRVVCLETESTIRVITALFDRGARPDR